MYKQLGVYVTYCTTPTLFNVLPPRTPLALVLFPPLLLHRRLKASLSVAKLNAMF